MRRNNQPRRELGLVHNPPIVRFTPNVFGFPDRLYTKVRYCDAINLASISGVVGTYRFRWNSTFDPDQSSVGHQPLYRDTYASIYSKYSVVKAEAKISVYNVDPGIGIICGVLTDDDTSSSSNFQTLMEQSHGINVSLTPLSGSKSEHIFNISWDCASILNIDPFTDDTYKTDVGSNPTSDSSLVIWTTSQDGTSTTQLKIRIELIQHVLWTELLTPTQS